MWRLPWQLIHQKIHKINLLRTIIVLNVPDLSKRILVDLEWMNSSKLLKIIFWLTSLLVSMLSILMKKYKDLTWLPWKVNLRDKTISNWVNIYYPQPFQSIRNTSRLLSMRMSWRSKLFLSYYQSIRTYTSLLLNLFKERNLIMSWLPWTTSSPCTYLVDFRIWIYSRWFIGSWHNPQQCITWWTFPWGWMECYNRKRPSTECPKYSPF